MGRPRANEVVSLLLCLIFAGSKSVMAGPIGSSLSTLKEVNPSILVVPQDNDIQQVLFATGFQIYVYNSTAWVLNNVSADLYNFKGIKIGFHYYLGEVDKNGGQATWQTFDPVSRVTGKPVTNVPQEDSIDWLLIQTTSQSGTKLFGLTKYVQRLYTQHGLQQAADVPAKEGDVFKSNYTALYTFSAPFDVKI